MERELEVARALAREAGRVLLEFYRAGTAVEWKGYDDPVTAADRAANDLIVRELQRNFPHDGILSEELPDDGSRFAKERLWLIDPMDGTKQFIEGIGEFAVMIGLAVAGEAKLGVVYNPVVDRMYYAAPGVGAFVEEQWTTKRLRVAETKDPAQMTAAMSRSHHSPRVDTILQRLGVAGKTVTGSVGLKLGLLAEGAAHIYLHLGNRTNQWDTCGPEAILRTAGGRVTDTQGDPLRYDRTEIRNLRGIAASNGPLHERILEEVKQPQQ